MSSSLRNRVMALALSVLTAVTTCAGAVPAWAEDVQADSTASSSVEQAAETAVVNVKLDSAGGSVVVGNGSDQETVRMQDDGTIKTTDAEGNETVAAVDETHPYAVTLTETKGAVVPVTATASDGYDVSTYTVTIDGGSEDTGFVSGGTFSYNLTADRDKTVEIGFAKKAGAETQTQAQAQPEAEAPASQPEAVTSAKAGEKVDTSAYDGMDFSSARLLVGTGDASVVTGDRDNILSSYDGLYLIQYPDAQAAKEAYAGYVRTADFVDVDNASLSAADGADITDITANNAMTGQSNPLAELADAPSGSSKKGTIALIDTGASVGGNVTEAVSMLGDSTGDDNGHGTKMVQDIVSENPDAKILSIKALDKNGKGTPSSVYAAIRYAIERKVSVINLSLSGTKKSDNTSIADAIKEAVNAGITVIGAAGNNSTNAKYMIPGSVDEAIIAGSVNENGVRQATSNYGDTVDYYVVSDTTSEAAAKLSGIFSRDGAIAADNKTVFKTAAEKDSGTDKENTDEVAVSLAMTNHETVTYSDGSAGYTLTYHADTNTITRNDGSRSEDIALGDTSFYTFREPKGTELNLTVKADEKDDGGAYYLQNFYVKEDGDAAAKNYLDDCAHTSFEKILTITKDTEILTESAHHYAEKGSVYVVGAATGEGRVFIQNAASESDPATEATIKKGDTVHVTFQSDDGHKLAYIVVQYRTVMDESDTAVPLFMKASDSIDLTPEKDCSVVGIFTDASDDTVYNMGLANSQSAWGSIKQTADDLGVAKDDSQSDDEYEAALEKELGLNTVQAAASLVPDTWTGTCFVGEHYTTPVNQSINVSAGGYSSGTGHNTVFKIDALTPVTLTNGKTVPISFEGFTAYKKRGITDTMQGICTQGHDKRALGVDAMGTDDSGSGPQVTVPYTAYKTSESTSNGTTNFCCWLGINETGAYTSYQAIGAVATGSFQSTQYGYLRIHKSSSDPSATNGNSNYSFAGGYYEIWRDAAFTQGTGKSFTLDANGYSNTVQLEVGTYYIREITAPKGYMKSGTVYTANVTTGSTANAPVTVNVTDTPKYGYIRIHKSSSDPDITNGNPSYSFEGGSYGIWKDAACTQGTGKSFTLDANGNSNTLEMPLGTYYIKEITAPKGYMKSGTVYTANVTTGSTANAPVTVNVTDTPKYGYIRIHKSSSNPDMTNGNPCYSLSGGYYGIWKNAACTEGTGKAFNIDANGYSNVVELPAGTYYIREITAPKGYMKSGTVYTVNVTTGSTANAPVTVNVTDTPITSYVYLTKSSSNPDVTHNNRCYSLKNGVFELTNASTGKKYTLTTDENGNTPTIEVGLGTYHVIETAAPYGYQKNTSIPDITVTNSNVKSNAYHIQVQDTPGVDPVPLLLQKRDAETGKGTPQGAASLAGAQYTVKYYDVQNADEDSLKDETPLRTWVLATDKDGALLMFPSYKVSGDEFYYDSLTNVVGVPIGTMLIEETKAPDGYQLNDKVYTVHFNMDANGNVRADVNRIDAVDDAADQVKALEAPQRGGLNFLKYDTENRPMAGVPFVITSETTGESHVVVADENGRVNTEANKHSNNTNGNDSLVRKTAEGGYVCDDPSKLDAGAGVWFGEAAADDSKMALLFDKYTIDEVFVKDLNYGKNISNKRKNDTKENKAGSILGVVIDTNGKNVSLDPEVWENPDVTLGTTAKNADVDSKEIALTDTATVVDTVSYGNLTPGDSYTLKGKLVDKDNPSVAVAEAETTFTPDKKDGTVDVTFRFDSSSLEGKTLVAFEYLHWKGIEIAKHEEAGDTAQTVYVPKLRTTLTDKAVEDEVGVKAKDDTLVDTVRYWNLAPHENFIIKGQLIQKSTGKVLAKADTGEFSVGAKSMNGTKNVTFTFDSTGLAGETVVAYEKLYHVSDEGDLYELDKHEDIEDIDQSVYFPKIGTTAADGKTGDHVGTSGKTETLVDTVKLNNVVVGKEYTVRGTLVDKKTGKAVLVNNKEITAEGTVTFDANGKAKVTGSASNAQGVLNAKNSGKTIDGSVDLTFTFNSSVLEGQTVVAFEKLLHKNIEVESHNDIKDEGQSVHYPKVGTAAKDGYTQDTVGTVGAKATIVDTVKLENLVPGMTYTVSGILKDQKSGADFTVNGKTVTQSASVTVNADGTLAAKNNEKVTAVFDKDQNRVDGTVDLTFTFDSSALSGKSVVAFEDLGHNNITVAVHHDIHDDGQTVHYPEIHTTAVDKTTGDHVGSIFGALINGLRRMFGQTDADGNGIPDDRQQNIVDTVTLANLVPGKSYVVSGKLMDADTGKAIVIDGKKITSSTVITVSKDGISSSNGCKTVFDNYDSVNHDVDGSVDLTFTLDSSKIHGVETVVFERLYHADGYTSTTETPDWKDETHLINKHEDKDDNGQSVNEVSIHTTAVDMVTGNDQGVVPSSYATSSVIEDTVELAKLVPGASYQIRGRLVDLTDSDFKNGKVVYLKSDGSATDNINEAVTVTSNEFDAQASEETHKIRLTVSGSLVQGKDVTVFEDILHNGVVLSSHPAKNTPETWDKDEFKSQTVHYMIGKTNAADGVENIHSTIADGTRTIEDKVYFQNLVAGKTYSIEGTLHDKATGEALTDKGATRKVTFTASEDLTEAACDSENTGKTETTAKVSDLKVTEHFDGTKTISGYVTLKFMVDASELAGHTLVAFEKFTNEGKEIFVHEDLEDLPQTIKIPKIGTTAKVGELDETALYNEDGTPKEFTITDTVSYENLWTKELLDKLHEEGLAITDNGTVIASDHTPVYDINETGEYTMTGKLMDKATGKVLTDVNGNEYETSVHFVPDAETGTVDVTFTLKAADFIDKDGSCILDGKSIVVFEDLYQVPEDGETSKDNHTAVHHDIDDQGQDIRFPKGRTHATDYTDGDLTQDELSALSHEDLAKIAADHESEVTIDSHEAEATDTMKILDMVSYSNLHAGTTYNVTGTLQVVTKRDENGKAVKWEPALDDDGKEITQTVTFITPEDEDGQDSVSGYVPVLFSFKGANLAGNTTVAFEKFTRKEQDVMVHHDITDKPQTDYIPSIHTNATDSVTGNHNGVVDEKTYVIDEVSYENLQKGNTYKLSAQLMDKDSLETFGSAVEGTFVAGTDGQFITPDGTVISTMDGMRKALKDNSKLETVKNTEKTKKETTKETTEETAEPSVEVTTAEVGNGIAKGNYVVTANEWKDGNWGFVHVFDKDPENGGKLVNAASLSDGSSVISLTDGEFVQYFNVNLHKNSKADVSEIDAEKIEEIYNADMDEIASLKSDTAENTEETDESSEETSGKTAETDVTVSTDSQSEAVENENDRVSGSVYVVIPVDASKLGGHTLVAFEKLYTNPENGTPKEIAHHEDINDEDQSVHYIDVHTNATDKKDGDKTLATSGTVTVNDKVSFKNLIPGKKYKVAGTLMDKKTGNPLTVNGKTVTSESTFTPNAADGYVNMEFTFDVTTVASGDYVAFEKLYDSESGAEIAKHEDMNDKSQTVTVPARPEIQTSDRPISPVLPIAAGVAVVAIIAAVLLSRKKKTDK